MRVRHRYKALGPREALLLAMTKGRGHTFSAHYSTLLSALRQIIHRRTWRSRSAGKSAGTFSNDAFCRVIKSDKFYAVLPSLHCPHHSSYCEAFREARKSKLDFQFLAYR